MPHDRRRITLFNSMYILLLTFLLFVPLCALSVAGEEDGKSNEEAIKTYQEHRQAFVARQNEIRASFQDRQGSIEKQIANLESKISEKKEQLKVLNRSISQNNAKLTLMESIKTDLAIVAFPLVALLTSMPMLDIFNNLSSASLLFIFLPITAFNMILFVFFKKKEYLPSTKSKTILCVIIVLLMCSMAAPLFADELSDRERVIQQLGYAEKVLSLSDHERFIAILESGVSNKVNLPSLESGDPLLKVYREVYINTPKYYFTLAALYTHENKTGKAVNVIGKLTSEKYMAPFADSDLIIINSIKFLIQHKHTKLASSAIANLGDNIVGVPHLLDLAVFLQGHGMQVSADKILSDVIERAKTTEDLTSLAEFFIEKQENDKGTEALMRALDSTRSIEDIILIAKVAIQYNKDSIIEKLVKKVKSVSRDYASSIKVVDMFLQHGRQEDAILVFSDMISAIRKRTPDYTKRLLYLTEAALQRNLLEQAVVATSKLSMYLGEQKYNLIVKVNSELDSSKGLPDRNKITLPLFFGLLSEELNFNSKAEDVYIQTVLSSLANILKSYGYDIPESLNDFHLLGRIWVKEGKGELLAKLDTVYNVLEKQFLISQESRYKNTLIANRQQLNLLTDKNTELKKIIAEKSATASATGRKVFIHTLGITATILFMFVVLIGCGFLAWKYSQDLMEHKTFGFITRFVELTGWVRVFSILAIPSGLICILIAQFLQIIQKMHENSYNSLAGRATALPAEKRITGSLSQQNLDLNSTRK